MIRRLRLRASYILNGKRIYVPSLQPSSEFFNNHITFFYPDGKSGRLPKNIFKELATRDKQ